MALFIADAAFAAARWTHAGGAGAIDAWLPGFAFWHFLAGLFCLAAAGGVVSVLLYGVLQRTPGAIRARMLAANNVVNAAFMVAAALALMGLHGLGLASSAIFAVLAVLALAVALAAFRAPFAAPRAAAIMR